MPKRTNEKQQVIEMLKAMTAAAGWTVKPSGFLLDHRLGEHFEVDVVAEKVDDGQTFIQSFEVVGKDRPATLGWTREMISKHESLPTDRLFLISWSGFVANARKEADLHPWVTLIEPTAVQHGKAEGFAIFVEEVDVHLRHYALLARSEEGNPEQIAITPSSVLLRADGTPCGHPEELANELVRSREFGARASEVAHHDPQRETATEFTASISLEPGGLRVVTNGVDKLIHEIWVKGDFKWRQERVEMTVRAFGDLRFKHGKGTIGGKPHVIVAALKQNLDVEKIKVQPEVADRRRQQAHPATSPSSSGLVAQAARAATSLSSNQRTLSGPTVAAP